MAKRKNKVAKKQNNLLTYIAWSLATIALILSCLIAGYYVGYNNAIEDIQIQNSTIEKKIDKPKKTTTTLHRQLKEVLKKETIEIKPKKTIIKTASHEYESLAKPPSRLVKKQHIITNKPKLAIIIDDVSIKSHINAIKNLNLKITMSFLPPSKARPNSAKLASKEKFYMVHLPMEAEHFTAEEPLTMRIHHSQQEITKRIKELKKLFPRVKYINNHTGSKFTSNEIAVHKLIVALNKYNINFIDSRTTSKTKVPLVMKEFGKKYMARDIFLDNRNDKEYIKNQIKKAIQIAKREGYAIAIGHPHINTILAINESKKLFKDVELVYVNRLY